MFKRREDYPREGAGGNTGIVLLLFFLSVVFYTLAQMIPDRKNDTLEKDMIEASRIMAQASDVLKECRKSEGFRPDLESDVNGTGLLGLEHSVITTSIGHLEAKRTSTNPNFAGLVVSLLDACGVKAGDTIAVGASSSFPALIVAALSAAKALDVHPLVISSLGASQWGANNPDFHWLKMWACLSGHGVFSVNPIAVSLGGDRDSGEDMEESGRALLQEDIRKSGIPFLSEPDLASNVRLRMDLYRKNASGKKIMAFINIGGSWANIGTDSSILHLKPGLNRTGVFPSLKRRGVISAMASENIPVIHLLYIRGLARDHGLPWDPVPLPRPGEDPLYDSYKEKKVPFVLLAGLYLVLVLLVIIFWRRPLMV
ncbi:MAG: poly-gamma-glutamate system protein [Candidatus Aminicenantes bacterium]|nr:poly-gamma-glutamate system protein [Candidatus Aminicenantes bacterium]